MKKTATVIMISSVKGGTSKTTLASCLSILGVRSGKKVVTLDFDEQEALRQWNDSRNVIRRSLPDIMPLDVHPMKLREWRDADKAARGPDLVIIDMPPNWGPNTVDYYEGLARLSDVVLIPVTPKHLDIRANEEWWTALKQIEAKAFFILSMAKRNTRSFREAQERIGRFARLLPGEIPEAEDMHIHAANGLTALDVRGARGTREIEHLWNVLHHEIAL